MSLPIHLHTTGELSLLLKRAPETLIRWRRQRVGPPFLVIEGRVLYDEQEVRRWLESGRDRRAASASAKRGSPEGVSAETMPAPTRPRAGSTPQGFVFDPDMTWQCQDNDAP